MPRIVGYSFDNNGIVFNVAVDAMSSNSDSWAEMVELFGDTSVIVVNSFELVN